MMDVSSTGPGHVLLVGFMGSGKSTVARLLALRLGRPLVDLDERVVAQAGMTIPQIFADEGEEGFRARETSALAALADERPSVVSCGGGVCTVATNRELLARLGTVVYLEVTVDEAISRIPDSSSRPLLSDRRGAEQLLERRRADYERCATFSVDTSGATPEEVCAAVVAGIRRRHLV